MEARHKLNSFRSSIGNSRDFWAGLMFLATGAGFYLLSGNYNMGSARHMGPAYFPTILSAALAVLGLLIMLQSLRRQHEPLPDFSLRSLVLILVSVIVFGALIRGAGLIPALMAMVGISAAASFKFNPLTALFMAVVIVIFSVAVFVFALGLPIAAFGPWFEG